MSKIITIWEPMNAVPPVYSNHQTTIITNEELQVDDCFQWYQINEITNVQDTGYGDRAVGANAQGQHGLQATRYYYTLVVEPVMAPATTLQEQ